MWTHLLSSSTKQTTFLICNIYIYNYEWRNWYIKLEITMTRKSSTHLHVTYGALNSCFDLIRSHQQCTPWSPPLEIEPTPTVCRSRGGRVRCREYVPIKKRHIRSSGRAVYHDLLIRYRLYVVWTSGPVVEFRLLHTVVEITVCTADET